MRTLVSLFCMLSTLSVHAFELCKAEKGEGYVIEQLKLVQAVDAEGQAKMKSMFVELKQSANMNEEQLLSYSMKLVSKPEISKFQGERMDHSMKLASLLSGKNCDEFNRINQLLIDTAEREWAETFKLIAADIKSYKK